MGLASWAYRTLKGLSSKSSDDAHADTSPQATIASTKARVIYLGDAGNPATNEIVLDALAAKIADDRPVRVSDAETGSPHLGDVANPATNEIVLDALAAKIADDRPARMPDAETSAPHLGDAGNPVTNETMLDSLAAEAADDYLVLLPDTSEAKEFAGKIPASIKVRLIPQKASLKGKAALPFAVAKRSSLAAKALSGYLGDALSRERKRLLQDINITELAAFGITGKALDYIVCAAPCKKAVMTRNLKPLAPVVRKGISTVAGLCKAGAEHLPEPDPAKLSDMAKRAFFNDNLQMNLVTRRAPNTEDACVLTGIALLHAPENSTSADFSIVLGTENVQVQGPKGTQAEDAGKVQSGESESMQAGEAGNAQTQGPKGTQAGGSTSTQAHKPEDAQAKETTNAQARETEELPTSFGALDSLLRIGTANVVRYRIAIPNSLTPTLADHTEVRLRYTPPTTADGFDLEGTAPIFCNLVDHHVGERKRWRALLDERANTALFFHHGPKNHLTLGARHINPTDYRKGRLTVEAAYWLTKIRPRKDAIVLYEKNASRYEESASVVYEALVDAGHKNVRFILDDAYPQRESIPERYRANIVSKNSLEHYRLFFGAKTFIGTEMLVHCAELGSSSRRIGKRLKDPTLNYVFLQHGVMYMVSLDSTGRAYFGPRKTTTGKHRVVVSSELEKRHFMDKAGYPEERLYVCGLPKFDRLEWSPDADRIVIMPTWRPWELNAARTDFRSTGYYRLLERIVACIPDELSNKIVVLAHPLFQQVIGDADFPLKRFMPQKERYDDILKNTKVLVTDYSSITYDAFYRGANVVFFWPEKDECLKRYGPNTTLMLDEESAFGDVCYTDEELTASVQANFQRPQTDDHVQRYRRIVEFHDGHNTERLVGFLESDGVI
ncbi:MAG: CDP-glycerol glycerophosphotransferase family protein [Eggerthellaceae bacterium]|nr:CDP-glycerol glycerophosphotransferase family protein [Eggerthellaceae bacterium]